MDFSFFSVQCSSVAGVRWLKSFLDGCVNVVVELMISYIVVEVESIGSVRIVE